MALALSLVFCFLLLRLSIVVALPHHDLQVKDRSIPGCTIPSSPYVSCQDGVVTFRTGSGNISGALTSAGAIRFTVKYATAQRFQPPQVAQVSPSSFLSAGSMPPLCPQPWVDSSAYSEDCLYFVAYAPSNAAPVRYSGGAPVLVWIHGGSYYYGGASDPYLEGSKLAQATGSIVVVLQYRLGALGYLPPSSLSGNKNLGVQDVVAALKYIQTAIGCVGGDKSKVVLAGQSSGANMIRNLLGTPSASSLFSRAILESDPMTYGFLRPSTFTNLQTAFYGNASCGSCLNTPVATLLNVQSKIIQDAPTIDPATGMPEPIRPVLDGSLITYSLTTTFPPTLKPLLVTSVQNEAGSALYGSIGYPVPPAYYTPVASSLFNPTRAAQIDSQYQVAQESTDDIRPALVDIITDGAWRCPEYTFARSWASKGGNVWVAEFTLGATYTTNTDISYCTSNGHVCHQDDIPIVFGTTNSPTAAQTALTAQVQARFGAFIKNANPNTSSFGGWNQVTRSGSVPVLNLGGTAAIPLGACNPSVWGSAIQYDYQVYGQ